MNPWSEVDAWRERVKASPRDLGEWRVFAEVRGPGDFARVRVQERIGGEVLRLVRPCSYNPRKWRVAGRWISAHDSVGFQPDRLAAWFATEQRLTPALHDALRAARVFERLAVERDRWLEAGQPRRAGARIAVFEWSVPLRLFVP